MRRGREATQRIAHSNTPPLHLRSFLQIMLSLFAMAIFFNNPQTNENDTQWQRLSGNQFMYHNRLRAGEYLELFRAANFNVLINNARIDEKSLSAPERGMCVSSKFAHFSPEELAITKIKLIAQPGVTDAPH
jgi:hypothetical protein